MPRFPKNILKILCIIIIITTVISTVSCKIPLETGGDASYNSGIGIIDDSRDALSDTDNSTPDNQSSRNESSGDLSGEQSGEYSSPNIDGNFTAKVDEYVYHIPERYYSEGIKNIVRRARQIYEMRWVPLSDLTCFDGDYVFEKGVEVQGIPYGQPVYSGKFVGFDATIDEFYSQSKIKNSEFYTQKAQYVEYSTFYSLDCTAFVCYAWNTNVRMFTGMLVQFGDYVSKRLKDVQVGDALIKTGENAHAVLVTGVIEDDRGNIVWLEITEQTPPLTKRTRYGEGELYSLEEFVMWYLNDGFGIYRNTDYRNGTPYNPSDSVPLDKESGNGVLPYRHISATSHEGYAKIKGVFASNENIKEFFYSVTPLNYGIEKFKTRSDATLRLRTKPVNGDTLDFIPPGTVLTIMDYYIDGNGEKWGKLRYNGSCGWFWVEGSEKLGGSLGNYAKNVVPNGNTTTRTVAGYSYAGMECEFNVPRTQFLGNCQIILYARTAGGKVHVVGTVIINFDE